MRPRGWPYPEVQTGELITRRKTGEAKMNSRTKQKHLLDSLAEPDKWTVDDIITIRTEVLYAQAYAKKFAVALAPWAAKWREPMQEVDYVGLMRAA
jgi:hypothetical protein